MRLLIVDDELHIRTGLTEEVDWKALNIEDVYTANNGVEAIELCEKYKPEIIITDIRMPGIDGLELCRQVSEMYNPAEIIILSGYSEFEYAKQAIKYGVSAYLLKPIEIDELIEVVKEAISLVESYYVQTENKKTYDQANRRQILKKIIYNNELNENDLEILKKHIVPCIHNNVVAGVFSIDDTEQQNQNQLGIYLQSILADNFSKYSYCILYWEEGELLFLISFSAKVEYERIKSRLEKHLQDINKVIKLQFNNSLSLALSSLGTTQQTPILFIECKKTIKHRLYLGGEKVLFTDSVEANNDVLLSPLKADELKRSIDSFEYENVHKYLECVFNTLREIKVTSSDFIRGICRHARNILIETLQEKGVKVEQCIAECPSLAGDIPRYLMIEKYFEWIDNLFSTILDKFYQLNGTRHSRVIIQVVDYISNHYAEEINLKVLSDYTGRSKNYLGFLFKKEMNISFIDYLNDTRIKHAKRKLRNTDDLIYEIADSVGFSDYKYFSLTFKKITGTSPLQYRKNNTKS